MLFNTVSIIIPVYNGGALFEACLKSLKQANLSGVEVIVVADGESDGSWRAAKNLGFHVQKLPQRGGPAKARNMGAQLAKADILFFIDADVTIYPNTIDKIKALFQRDLDLDAVIGSYDDAPMQSNFLSQYKNLLHHYVHQRGNPEASTFWGACGAIRRSVFLKIGGFNETYRDPSIEDIELGYRLRKDGYKLMLCKDLHVKHLKRWSPLSLLKTDFYYRAIPWSRLLMQEGKFINDLNISLLSRLSVALIYSLIGFLMLAPWIPQLLFAAFAVATALFFLNLDLYRFFTNKRGLLFAVKTIPWHWFYYVYSGAAFFIEFTGHHLKRQRTSV